ncbi:MAG: heavy metal-associated domain-containing protein [Bacteroidota bacterium]
MMTKAETYVIFLIGSILLALTITSCGEPKKNRFFVEGNCQECGPLIEKVLSSQPGVDSAGWNMKSSLVVVKFFPQETNPDQLQQALSKAGFNTQFYPGDEEAREALPICCQQRIDRSLERYEPKLPAGH